MSYFSTVDYEVVTGMMAHSAQVEWVWLSSSLVLNVAYINWIHVNSKMNQVHTYAAQLTPWTIKDMDGLLAICEFGMIWICLSKMIFQHDAIYIEGLYKHQYALESEKDLEGELCSRTV